MRYAFVGVAPSPLAPLAVPSLAFGGERKDQSTWPNPQSTSRKVLINLGDSAVRESN
jgi:hypothetical protein